MPQVDYAALAEQARKQSDAPPAFGVRADGSPKGNGFLGALQRPDGKVSSEISIGVNIDGKEVEIPTLVPTLTPQEKQWLLTNDVSDPSKLPKSIIEKAVEFARPRLAAGQSPFATQSESPVDYAALAEQARTTAPPKPASMTPQEAIVEMGRREQERTASGAKAMPTVLGAAGGVMGGLPGAAAGGAVGKALEQTVLRGQGDPSVPATISGQAKDIALSGALQGAAEGAGQVLAYGAKGAGTWLMNRAINATDRLSREFPEMSKTLIDNAITVSQGGLNKARRLLSGAKAEANGALRTAEAQGVTIPVTAATNGLSSTLKEVMNSGNPVGGLSALAKAETNITLGRPANLTPTAADALKRSLQQQSKQLYTAAKMGNGHPGLVVAAQAKADMAAALNDAIEQATSAVGATGYKAANHSAQELIGAVRGITKATRPGANLYQAMVRPGVGAVLGSGAGETQGHPVLGALVGAALTSPGTMSREAVILAHPAMQSMVKQLPRGLAGVLKAYLDEQAQTPSPSPSTRGAR